MNQLLACMLASSLAFGANAADIPEVDAGDAGYDAEMCVENTANDCINTICLTSEERDCQDQCQKDAEDFCDEQSD